MSVPGGGVGEVLSGVDRGIGFEESALLVVGVGPVVIPVVVTVLVVVVMANGSALARLPAVDVVPLEPVLPGTCRRARVSASKSPVTGRRLISWNWRTA